MKKNVLKKAIPLTVAATMMNVVPVAAYDKDETVYTKVDGDGNVTYQVVSEQLKSSKEAEAEEAFNEEIIDKLIENTPFEVPDAMVETEVQNIISEINANLQQQGLTLELYQQMTGQTMDQLKADVRDNAEKRVKYQLIVAEIVKAENIEVSDEELAEEIKNIATYYGREEEEVKKIFAGQEDRIKEDVASRKAVDLVKENVAK